MSKYEKIPGCAKLREWRQGAGLTQMQLATELGLSSSTIVSDIERGVRTVHDVGLAVKIEKLTRGWIKASDWTESKP